MAFKTITIKQETYKDLIKVKISHESFSALFKRLLQERRPNLKDFYGAWKLEKGEAEKMESALKGERNRLEESWKKRHHENT